MCVIWFYLILAFLRFSFAPCHVLENVLVGPGTSVCWHLLSRVNEIDETERDRRGLVFHYLSRTAIGTVFRCSKPERSNRSVNFTHRFFTGLHWTHRANVFFWCVPAAQALKGNKKSQTENLKSWKLAKPVSSEVGAPRNYWTTPAKLLQLPSLHLIYPHKHEGNGINRKN